ncbi:H-NS family nucleoid-associated regulatory protein [Variovorax sp. RB2P76]|uniref:H-NS histone family protein n=1 Tax=Variovorax sp. RB2P76 TaxID=3443736 RepID=UPI003F448925
MAQTLAQITKQIEKLQKEADALRHAELKGVVDRIKVAIAHYGLTPDQLGFGKPAVKSAKPAKAVARSGNKAAAPRFANDEGQVWSGRGPRPRWLREALASGRSLEEFSTDARKRTSPASPEPKPRNVGAVVVRPAKTKRAKASTKQTELAAHPAPSLSDATADAHTPSTVAPQSLRAAKPSLAKPASAKKASATKASPVTAKRAPQVKAKRANRVVAAPSKGTTGVSAEKSSTAAPASAAP